MSIQKVALMFWKEKMKTILFFLAGLAVLVSTSGCVTCSYYEPVYFYHGPVHRSHWVPVHPWHHGHHRGCR
ncbi:MAG: hypothetical protein UW34_C0001G0015 [Parcubacteria group bacterium GW2011_GWA2_44_15]|nr:MAG: hypothetical protein UW34_C0001G0015 [Parcubacteria group bacterium GW2011_GWA2_44_15]